VLILLDQNGELASTLAADVGLDTLVPADLTAQWPWIRSPQGLERCGQTLAVKAASGRRLATGAVFSVE
jgi:hypothetical protein